MTKLIITIFIFADIVVAILCILLWTEHKEKLRYRDAALKNGRARLQRDEKHRDEIGQINRRAAKRIADQNATIEDLMAQIRLLEMINRNYKKQLERRQS
jgi:FtsZ-interacting cell division protein ZipA